MSAPSIASNVTVKDRIRDYWSARAATFDEEAGHGIEPHKEAPQWQALFSRALGPLAGQHVLDLACGTGQISRVLTDLGARVTGVDFAEPMLARARMRMQGLDWTGVLDDAELLATQADATFDAVVTRHLVRTLPDAPAAFRAWHRVLKPGRRVLIVDGDWRQVPAHLRVLRAVADWIERRKEDRALALDYGDLWRQLSYGDGLTPEALQADLVEAGFAEFRQHSVVPIYLRGLLQPPLARRLRLLAARRFAMSAVRLG